MGNEKATEMEWMLTEPVRITKISDTTYLAEELGGDRRRCEIECRGPWLYFDGEYVDAGDEFPAILGLLDAADDSPDGVADFRGGE